MRSKKAVIVQTLPGMTVQAVLLRRADFVSVWNRERGKMNPALSKRPQRPNGEKIRIAMAIAQALEFDAKRHGRKSHLQACTV